MIFASGLLNNEMCSLLPPHLIDHHHQPHWHFCGLPRRFYRLAFSTASQHYRNYAYIFHVNVSNMHFLIEFSERDKHRKGKGSSSSCTCLELFEVVIGLWFLPAGLDSPLPLNLALSTSPGTFTLYLRPRFKHLSNHILIRTPFLSFSLSFMVGSSVSMQPGPKWAWKPPPSCSASLTPACLCRSHPSPQPLMLLAGFIHVCHPRPQAI